jgi:hypothetical protein
MIDLPPPNAKALGLHLTDEEWCVILDIISADPSIIRARIYGSRQAGVRRCKDPPQPLDIDIAIEVYDSDPTQAFQAFWSAKDRLIERAGKLRIQVEDLTDSASGIFTAKQQGVLVFEREGLT